MGDPVRAVSLFASLLFAVVACHGTASEPVATSASASASPSATVATPPPRTGSGPELHRIVFADHRHVVNLRVGDRIAIPIDPEIDWHVTFEDKSAFERVPDADAGSEVYRITKPGPLRVMAFGDPKCLKASKTDAKPCGVSRRRWDVTFAAE